MKRRWLAALLLSVASFARAGDAPSAVPVSVGLQPDATQTFTIGPYAYDGSGNIKSIGTDQVFVYDAFGRIIYGKAATGRYQRYTYDRFGNLLTVATDQDTPQVSLGADRSTNRLIDTTKSAWGTYDGAGRLLTAPPIGVTFTYDATGMATTQATSDDGTRLYLYSASDERIATVTLNNNVETRSEWTLRDPSGRVLRRLERNAGNWSWAEDYVYRDGQLLASEVPSGTQHFHLDHLGTPRLITGSGGVEVSRHTYYAFGKELVRQTAEKAKFTGHERDFGADAGRDLDYMHARYYGVAWGRFLSPDPGGFEPARPQSWNRYTYVMNNPIGKIDPNGRDTWDVVNGAVNAVTNDMSVGTAPRLDGNADFRSGQQLGDLLALVAGAYEATQGAAADGAGAVLDAGVVTAPAGAVVNAVATAAVVHGVATGTVALIHLSSSTKGLEKQVKQHEQKLKDYQKNPDAHDNKGFLKNATPEQRRKIIESRIASLKHQIETFKKKIIEIVEQAAKAK